MSEFTELTLKKYIDYILFKNYDKIKEGSSFLFNDDEPYPEKSDFKWTEEVDSSKLSCETYFTNIYEKFGAEYKDFFKYLIYSGTNDYREYGIGQSVYIPKKSQYGGGVYGNGLYATSSYDVAQAYANATASTLFSSGNGCAKHVIIREIGCDNLADYNLCKGIILKEKKDYSEEEWNRHTKGKHFILSLTLDELVFIDNMDGKIVYKNINKEEPTDGLKSICKKPFNLIEGTNANIEELKLKYPHECHKTGVACPSTCEYLKSINQLPKTGNLHTKTVNCSTGEYEVYKNKYLKYKMKYLELKKSIKSNSL